MDAADNGRGISQAELARRAKVTRAAVAHWLAAEGDTYPMKGEVLLRVAYELKVSPFWLLVEYGTQNAAFIHDSDALELLGYFYSLPSAARATATEQVKQLFNLLSTTSNSVTTSYSGSMDEGRYQQKLKQAQADLQAASLGEEYAKSGKHRSFSS